MRMRATLVTFAVLFLAAFAEAANDEEVQARNRGLELAGAFSNDGYKIRDGHWLGTLKPKVRQLVAVNLYAGNQYWFSAGANEKVKKIGVEVFDESGQRMPTEPYSAGEKAAAGFSPTSSGQYFVAVSLMEGEAATCCLIYSYK